MENSTFFETKDMALVAYLLAKGHRYINPQYKDGAVWFTIQTDSEVQDLIFQYYDRKALVDPIEFNTNFKNLAHLVGNLKRGGEQR